MSDINDCDNCTYPEAFQALHNEIDRLTAELARYKQGVEVED